MFKEKIFIMENARNAFVTACLLLISIVSVYSSAAESNKDGKDKYTLATEEYFDFLGKKDFKNAYEMLSNCKIIFYNASGSGGAYQPRSDLKEWLNMYKNLVKIQLLNVKLICFEDNDPRFSADSGFAESVLNIRHYQVNFEVKYKKEIEPEQISGTHDCFFALVEGSDKKIRILGIGTGP